MTKRAEYQGECQICGCQQKLPKGVLSLHGYNVRMGFFSGTCSGANHLPFEQSKDLIESAIERALAEAVRLDGFADELDKPAVEPKAFCSVYRDRKQARHENEPTGQVTVQGVIRRAEKAGMGRWFIVTASDGREYSVSGDSREDVLHVATTQNRRHAQYIRSIAHQARDYAAWQTKRIANWQPKELTPVPEEVARVHFEGLFMRKTPTAFCAAGSNRARNMTMAPRTTDRSKVTCAACLRSLASMDKYEAEEKAKAERAAAREKARADKEAAAEAKRAAKAAR
jgi:hypothetical protein